jgi:hypothetical protein
MSGEKKGSDACSYSVMVLLNPKALLKPAIRLQQKTAALRQPLVLERLDSTTGSHSHNQLSPRFLNAQRILQASPFSLMELYQLR